MKIDKFEDIIARQKAKLLNIGVYKQMQNCRDFEFRNQLQRASVSIMNNIAEGFERKTNKEFINFLYISKGSCAEARSMFHLGLELKYISRQDYEKFYNLSLEISKILSGLIKTL